MEIIDVIDAVEDFLINLSHNTINMMKLILETTWNLICKMMMNLEYIFIGIVIFILALLIYGFYNLYYSLPFILFKYISMDIAVAFTAVTFLFLYSFPVENIYDYCVFQKKYFHVNLENYKESYLEVWKEKKYHEFVTNKRLVHATAGYEIPVAEKVSGMYLS